MSAKSSDNLKSAEYSTKNDNRNSKDNVNNEWIPTEKIVQMWIDKKEKKGDRNDKNNNNKNDKTDKNGTNVNTVDLGSVPTGQRMRASVTSESLQVFFRFSEEECY